MPTDSQDDDTTVRRAHAAATGAADVSPVQRAAWLTAVAHALSEHDDRLVALAQPQSNLREALPGELRRTSFQLELLAKEVTAGLLLDVTIDHADPHWGMGPRPDLRRMNVPLGAVGVSDVGISEELLPRQFEVSSLLAHLRGPEPPVADAGGRRATYARPGGTA